MRKDERTNEGGRGAQEGILRDRFLDMREGAGIEQGRDSKRCYFKSLASATISLVRLCRPRRRCRRRRSRCPRCFREKVVGGCRCCLAVLIGLLYIVVSMALLSYF